MRDILGGRGKSFTYQELQSVTEKGEVKNLH